METQYGTSSHYQGEKGAAYFAYQNRFAALGGKLDAQKFAPFVTENDSVLDFGCGGGWVLRELPCKERVGVELNEEAHAVCSANGIKVYKHIADVAERDFDLIISNHCLEHVPYPIEALRALRGLLSPTGKLVVVVPIDDWRTQTDCTGKDIDHHLQTWTSRLMANTLVEAGFAPLEIKILTHAWFPRWNQVYGRLPNILFDALCRAWSIKRKQRQLLAYAKKV